MSMLSIYNENAIFKAEVWHQVATLYIAALVYSPLPPTPLEFASKLQGTAIRSQDQTQGFLWKRTVQNGNIFDNVFALVNISQTGKRDYHKMFIKMHIFALHVEQIQSIHKLKKN